MRKIFILLLICSTSYGQEPCNKSKQRKIEKLFSFENYKRNYEAISGYLNEPYLNYETNEIELAYHNLMNYACEIFDDSDLKELEQIQNNSSLIESIKYTNYILNKANADALNADSIADFVLRDKDIEYILENKIKLFILKSGELFGELAIKKMIVEYGFNTDQGTILFFRGDFEKSLSYFDSLIFNQNELNYYNFLFKGKSESALGSNELAIKSLKLASGFKSDLSDAEYSLADIYFYDFGKPDSAFLYITSALEKNGEVGTYNLLLGQIYKINGKVESAIEVLSRIVHLEETKIEALKTRANCYYLKYEYKKARYDLLSILEVDSLNEDALLSLSDFIIQENNYDSVFYYLNMALRYYPKSDKVQFVYGNILLSLGNYKDALGYFNEAYSLNKNIGYLNNIGFCKQKTGDYFGASSDFLNVINEYEEDVFNKMVLAFTYNNLGFCYFKLNQLDNAIKNIDYSINLYNDNACAYLNRALVEKNLGNKDIACDYIRMSKSKQFLEYCDIDYELLELELCNSK